ncbi:hypothetical protein DFA_01114 [Cavenderia fasciculata]|uniref:Transmembrane protein n=1 Tax=Cavenderia fasciculata TaxID=261658 RepID=F4PQX4_CACFS|nr:uncharacterized protein DFA_01114 [Cavenderia fasciculata]EGG21239.1 hypothetical protein DFA_01114 [Cavenderia fasciculata]|eukprot:XP_004359089.1 hypothetical protein DFA_01114 [Cavenderia fasciculata]
MKYLYSYIFIYILIFIVLNLSLSFGQTQQDLYYTQSDTDLNLVQGAFGIKNLIIGSDSTSNITLRIGIGVTVYEDLILFDQSRSIVNYTTKDDILTVKGNMDISGEFRSINNVMEIETNTINITNSGRFIVENAQNSNIRADILNVGQFTSNASNSNINGLFINLNQTILIDSDFNLYNSTILKYNSSFIINSTTIQNIGNMESNGLIFIDSNSFIVNNEQGLMKFNNSIRLINNDTTSSSSTSSFINNGIIEIISGSSDEDSDDEDDVFIDVPVRNNGVFMVSKNTTIHTLVQPLQGSLVVSNNASVSSNQTINLDGQLMGNGTIRGSVENKELLVGDEKSISQLTIVGNYSESNDSRDIGTGSRFLMTIVSFNTSDHLNVTETATFGQNGTITIRVNQNLKDQMNMTVMTHQQKVGQPKSIKILTYDPNNNNNNNKDNSNCHSYEHGNNKLVVLVNYNCPDENGTNGSLTGAQIAGIVVGSVVGGLMVVAGISYFIFKKIKYTSTGLKLTKTMRNLK